MALLSDILAQAIELHGEKFVDGLEFGESPRFHDGKLYISDMTGGKIYAIDPSTKAKEIVVEVENPTNGMGFLSDGSLIYSSMFDRRLYRLNNGVSELYVDLSTTMTGYPGDMVIDQTDRIYVDDVGSRVLHGEPRRPGRVVIVDPDRSVRISAEGVQFPNGIAIDSSQTHLYLSASGARTLTVYNIGEQGNLEKGRVILDLAEFPDSKSRTACDGLCIDSEDGLWLSLLDSEVFVRRDRHGKITHVVHTDGQAVACALGGKDGRTLYMVTNKMPKGKTLFEAMMKRETQCEITTTRVDVGRGRGRP